MNTKILRLKEILIFNSKESIYFNYGTLEIVQERKGNEPNLWCINLHHVVNNPDFTQAIREDKEFHLRMLSVRGDAFEGSARIESLIKENCNEVIETMDFVGNSELKQLREVK